MDTSTYVKINGVKYPAIVTGVQTDRSWGNRDAKSITVEMDYTTAVYLFVDGLKWSIVYQPPDYVNPETQETEKQEPEEYDNSEYNVAGPITDNRDGTITAKMGKQTAQEQYYKASDALTILAGKSLSNEDEAKTIRAQFESAAQKLPDSDSNIAPSLFKAWNLTEYVEAGQRRYYAIDNHVYKAKISHQSSVTTFPPDSPDYWTKM